MIYFNGFALKGEEKFFEEQLKNPSYALNSDYLIKGVGHLLR